MTIEFVNHVFADRTLHMAYISKGIDNRIKVRLLRSLIDICLLNEQYDEILAETICFAYDDLKFIEYPSTFVEREEYDE